MIELSISNMTHETLGQNGLTREDIAGVSFKGIGEKIRDREHSGLDFLNLPFAGIDQVRELGRYARQFENFLLLGIGGSALGPRAILEALSPFHNLKRTPKVFIYDNVDPSTLTAILELIDLKKTVINVITKSGSTAETIASFMIVWERLKEQSLNPQDHLIITTDPEKGNLREIVKEYSLKSLPIPPGVGGRYSVLCPVGLLLAETLGIDSHELLRGARDIYERCTQDTVWQNPAYLLAASIFMMQRDKKRTITVMVPYADSLKAFSEWFCQLWAESLGKEGKGLTPYPSLGTTDQHSQLQLWMQGPEDKVIIFIGINDYRADIKIPDVFSDMEGIDYLSGHSLAELIKTELIASERALAKDKRPSATITLPAIDAYHLGQLFHFFEIITALEGLLIGIDPFNQPGVEEGKNLTYGMMGKKGFELKRDELIAYRKERESCTL